MTTISEVQVAFSPVPVAQVVADETLPAGSATFDFFLKDARGARYARFAAVFSELLYFIIRRYGQSKPLAERHIPGQPGVQTIYILLSSVTNPNCYDASQQFELEYS